MKKILPIILLALLALPMRGWAGWRSWINDIYYEMHDDLTAVVLKPSSWDGHRRSSVDIPNWVQDRGYTFDVTDIAEEAFLNRTDITSLSIGRNITHIGSNAFKGCTNITWIFYYAENLSGFGPLFNPAFANAAFYDSRDKINKVIFGDYVVRVPANAFGGLENLTRIDFPTTVTSVGGGAFYGCENVGYVNLPVTVPPTVSQNSFENPSNIYLKVPAESYGAYVQHPIWGQFRVINSLITPFAYQYQGRTLYYELDYTHRTATVVMPYHDGGWQFSPSGAIVIPDVVVKDGVTYTVTCIDERAFCGCDEITSVTIGANITYVAGSAFKGCDHIQTVNFNATNCTSMNDNEFYSVFNDSKATLTTVNIGSSVTKIPKYAFKECNRISSLSLPSSVNTIEEYAFYACTAMTGSLTFPAGFNLGNFAFTNCTHLSSVSINVSNIPAYVFSGCTGLTTWSFGTHVSTVGASAFSNCTGLSGTLDLSNVNVVNANAFENCSGLTGSINLSNMTTIGEFAFRGCSGLTGTPNLSHVNTIGASAFRGCSGLTGSITIPSSLSSLGEYAFSGCSGITSVTVNIAQIPVCAFSGCTGLNTVTIGTNVTNVKSTAFTGCNHITTVNFNAQNCNDMYYYEWNHERSVFCDSHETLSTLNIGNTVRILPQYSFYGCEKISSLSIPSSVTTIEACAFYGCSGMTGSLTIPASVTKIGEWAFAKCSGLTGSITIPATVTNMGKYVFKECSSLSSATLNIPVVPEGTFALCTGLTTVTIGTNVTNVHSKTFQGCDHIATVNFNALNCNDMYIYDFYNSRSVFCDSQETLTTLNIGNGVTIIPQYAFSACSHITSLSIPSSVTKIDECAFYHCSGITGSLTIPSSVTELGANVFRCCTGLSSVSVNSPVLPNNIFNGCTGLTEVTIGFYVTRVPDNAFYDCDHIVTVNFNAQNCSQMYIYEYSNSRSVFYPSHETFTTLNIGTAVTKIPSYSFNGCDHITSISIPASVATIEDYAFRRCSGLELIVVDRNTPPAVTDYSFNYSTDILLHVPETALNVYRNHEYWSRFLMASDVVVAGVMVTEDNADHITGTGISGSVSYDFDNHTLTLNNASITAQGVNAIISMRTNFNLNLVGQNTITVTDADAIDFKEYSLITGLGSLTVTSNRNAIMAEKALKIMNGCSVTATGGTGSEYCSVHGKDGCTLRVNSSTLVAVRGGSTYGSIGGFSDVVLSGCIVSEPLDVVWNASRHRYENAQGNAVTGRTVINNPAYDLWIGGNQVTAINSSDVMGDGKVSFDRVNNILTLTNVDFATGGAEAIRNEINGLTIVLEGSNRIASTQGTAIATTGDLTIKGNGSINVIGNKNGIRTNGNLTLQEECSVTIRANGGGDYSAVYGDANKTLTINKSHLYADAHYSYVGSIYGFQTVNLTNGSRIDQPHYDLHWSSTDHYYWYEVNNVQVQYRGIIEIDYHAYELYVADVQVTSANASNVLGDGKVTYDADHKVLTLNGVAISVNAQGIKNQIEGLRICLIGTNTITSNSSGIYSSKYFFIEGSGSLSVTGNDGIYASSCDLTIRGGCTVSTTGVGTSNYSGIYGSSGRTLTIISSQVTANAASTTKTAISGFGTLALEDVSITSPANGSYTSGSIKDANGTAYYGQVVISPNPYQLWVKGTQVNSLNAADVLGDGKVSYDAIEHILTLNGASISNSIDNDGIVNKLEEGLTLNLIGANTINVDDDGINMEGYSTTITGRGSLSITSSYGIWAAADNSSLTVADGCSVTVTSSNSGVHVYGPLTIRNAELKATGSTNGSIRCYSLSYEGCALTAPEGATYNPSVHYVIKDGHFVKEEVVFSPFQYNLYVQGFHVTSANAFDVLGDGKVTYDADEKVLTLNGASINNANSGGDGIDTGVDSLTIKLIGNNTITAGDDGIEILTGGTHTTIIGPGTLTSNSSYGVYCAPSDYTLTIAEGAYVVLNGSSTGVGMANSHLVVDCAELKAKGNTRSIRCASLTMELTSITAPAGAVFSVDEKAVVVAQGSSQQVSGEYVEITPDKYDIWIHSTQLTSANCSNFTDGVESGRVHYDWEEQWLYLNNATIHGGFQGEPVIFVGDISHLYITLVGDNYLIGDDAEGCQAIEFQGMSNGDNFLVFEGPGTLTTDVDILFDNYWDVYFEGCSVTLGGEGRFTAGSSNVEVDLNFNGSTLRAYSITDIGRATGATIMQPQDAMFGGQGEGVIYTNGQQAHNVVLGCYLNLWVAGTRVNTLNVNNITGPGISGYVSYDCYSRKLTLNNATIISDNDGIHSTMSDAWMDLILVGDNVILSNGDAGIYTTQRIDIQGTGSLLVSGTDGIYTENNLNVEGGCMVEAIGTGDQGAGIYGTSSKTLSVDANTTVRASTNAQSTMSAIDGFKRLSLIQVEILQPLGGEYNQTTHRIEDAQHNRVTTAEIGYTEYDLWIGDTRITSANANAMLNIPNVSGTYVRYNRSANRLTLNAATINASESNAAITNKIDGLTIELSGNSSILTGTYGIDIEAANTTFSGSGTLNISAEQGIHATQMDEKLLTIQNGCTIFMEDMTNWAINTDGTLRVNNATVDVTSSFDAIHANDLILDYVGISSPEGAYFNESSHSIVDEDGYSIDGQLVIEPIKYPLWVASTQVTAFNAAQITGAGISGLVSYDAEQKVLTLNNANLEFLVDPDEDRDNPDGIANSGIPDLTIVLVGDNTIHAGDDGISMWDNSTTITGRGTLTIDAPWGMYGYSSGNTSRLTIADGCSVTVNSYTYGIRLDGCLTVRNAELKATGTDRGSVVCNELVLENCSITEPSGAALYNGSVCVGNTVVKTQVVIEPDKYDIWVAGIQVTSINANDVLGDGTVSYDATANELTLNEAEISNPGGGNNGVRTCINGLTISLIGDNTISASAAGLKLDAGASMTYLVGPGSLTINASWGVYGEQHYNLTVKENAHVVVNGSSLGISLYYGDVVVDHAELWSMGQLSSSISCASLGLIGTEITAPDGAVFSSAIHGVIGQQGATHLFQGDYVKIVPERYDLYVAGTQVDVFNVADVLGDGTVSYDVLNKVLTLDGVDLNYSSTGNDAAIRNGIEDLKIELVGSNNIQSNLYGIYSSADGTCIQGAGILTVNAGYDGIRLQGSGLTIKDGCMVDVTSQGGENYVAIYCDRVGSEKLRIERSNVRARTASTVYSAIGGFEDAIFDGSEIVQPEEGSYLNGEICTSAGLVYHGEVIIEPTKYDLWVMGTQVNAANAPDVLGDGMVSYDPEGKELTLNEIDFDYVTSLNDAVIKNGVTDLKINLVGENVIASNQIGIYSYADGTSIQGSGLLMMTTQDDGIRLDGSSLTIQGGCSVMITTESSSCAAIYCNRSGNEILHIVGSNLTAQSASTRNSAINGFDNAVLDGVTFVLPEEGCYYHGEICTSNHQIYRDQVVISIIPYNLWVAGIQVTSANANNITGTGISGSVSYDVLNNTLTLNEASITCSDINGIETQIDDLKIALVGSNNITSKRGIQISGSVHETSIVGPGTLTVDATQHGFYYYNSLYTLTVSEDAQVTIEGRNGVGINIPNASLIVNRAEVWAKGKTASVKCSALTMGGVDITAPEGAEHSSSAVGVVYAGTTDLVKEEYVKISTIPYDLWVAGVRVTMANAFDIIGGGIRNGWVNYDAENKILTLNNVSLESSGGSTDRENAGIYNEGIDDLKISLIGENSVSGPTSSSDGKGILSNKSLTIQGPGTLNVTGYIGILTTLGDLSFIDHCEVVVNGVAPAIFGSISNTLTIDNSKVTANSPANQYPILGYKKLTLTDTEVTTPVGAEWSTTGRRLGLNGNNVYGQAIIEPCNVFTGDSDSNWETAASWSKGVLPLTTSKVIVRSDCAVNTNVSVKDIKIESTGSLIVNSGSILTADAIKNGTTSHLIIEDGAQLYCNSSTTAATFHKNITTTSNDDDGWHLIASPVNNKSVSGLNSNTYDIYAYDEDADQNEWQNYRVGSFRLMSGHGYLYANSGAGSSSITLSISGLLTPSNRDVAVELSYGATYEGIQGFNLIGNPYPRNLSLNEMTIDGQPVTEFYRLVEGENGSEFVRCTSGAILPGEGFFIKATAAGQVLTISGN